MSILQIELQKIIPMEQKVIGMILVYSDLFKKETRITEEYVDVINIIKFKAKHNLDTDLSLKSTGRKMIDYFNNSLRPTDRKRKFINVYIKYQGTYYIKS